jgi:hypothetical protein
MRFFEFSATDYSRPGRLITAVVQSVSVPFKYIREVGRASSNSAEPGDKEQTRVGGDSEGS